MKVGEETRPRLRLSLFQHRAARKHDVVAILVELEDLCLNRLTEVGGKVTYPAKLNERGGEKPTKTDINDEPPLDHLDNLTGHHTVRILNLLDVTPRTLVLRPLLGENESTLFVFLLKNKRLDRVTDTDNIIRVNIVLNGKFTGGDDTLGLVTDIEQNFVSIDLDNGALNEIAVIEELQRL